MTSPTKHSPYGPSGADRWMSCPGSISLIERFTKQFGETPPSPAAEEGTRAHEIAAKALLSGKPPKEALAEIPNVPEDWIDPLLVYLDAVTVGRELISDPNDFRVEAWRQWDEDPRIAGTADCICRAGNVLIVSDLKFGIGKFVDARSMQLSIYAFLALQDYPEVETVVQRIVQPRWRGTAEKVREVTYSAADLQKAVSEALRAALREVDENPHKFHMGSHCEWCPAQSICPEQRADLTRILTMQDQKNDIQYIDFVLKKEKQITNIIASAKKAAKRLLLDGGNLPDWELIETRGRQRWSQESADVEQALLAEGFPYSQICPAKLATPAQLRKKINNTELLESLTVRDTVVKIVRRRQEEAQESAAAFADEEV